MAKYADKYCCDISLNVGNLVCISIEHFPLAHQLSCKLAPHWVGYFPISSVISQVVYHTNSPEEYGHIHPVFYVNYLHSYVGPVPTHPPSPLSLNDAAAGEFEVEDIINSYLGHYGTEYLVKQLCYPVFEVIWEPTKLLAITLVFFIHFHLTKVGTFSTRGSDIRVYILLNNFFDL